MSSSPSVEEGEIVDEGEIVERPADNRARAALHAPRLVARGRRPARPVGRQNVPRRSREDSRRRRTPSPSSSDSDRSRIRTRRRRRSYRRSRSRSWSRPPTDAVPAADPRGAAEAAREQLSALASSIRTLTSAVALPDCLKNLVSVCGRLEEAVDKACTYCELAANEGAGGELLELSGRIHKGLRSLHVLSNTGRGREMSPARLMVQHAWRERAKLFAPSQVEAFSGWVGSSKNFAALLQDEPSGGRRQQATMPAPAHLLSAAAHNGRQEGLRAEQSGGRKREGKGEILAQPAVGRVPATLAGGPKVVSQKTGTEGEDGRAVGRPRHHANGLSAREIHNGLPSTISGIVPGGGVDVLLRAHKLCLVLDLDHTLLNSAMFSELDPHLGKWLEVRAKAQMELPAEQRELHRLDEIKMFTKLRPGVHQFLRQAAERFQLWIHTNGNKLYAATVTRLLDPSGAYFGDRIIAQGADRPEEMQRDQPKALERGLAALKDVSIIVDDTDSVWSAHSHNLVTVPRYVFFPSSQAQLGLPGPSLLQQNRDDNPDTGVLMSTARVLLQVHAAVFAALKSPPIRLSSGEVIHANWDTRHVLSGLRQQVLHGVHIVFSGVIPLGQPPEMHALWQLALRFGARCSTQVSAAVTHVVAGTAGTDKALQARAAGKFVVSPAWLEASCVLWKRAEEKRFPVGSKI